MCVCVLWYVLSYVRAVSSLILRQTKKKTPFGPEKNNYKLVFGHWALSVCNLICFIKIVAVLFATWTKSMHIQRIKAKCSRESRWRRETIWKHFVSNSVGFYFDFVVVVCCFANTTVPTQTHTHIHCGRHAHFYCVPQVPVYGFCFKKRDDMCNPIRSGWWWWRRRRQQRLRHTRNFPWCFPTPLFKAYFRDIAPFAQSSTHGAYSLQHLFRIHSEIGPLYHTYV